MALQDILQKISKETNKKAAFMKQVTNDEIKKIKEEAKMKAKERKLKIEEKIGIQSAYIIEKAKTLAKMEGRSTILKQKREVIDQTYKEVEKELNALSDQEYLELITNMVKHAMKSTKKGSLVVPESRLKQTEEAIEKAKADFDIKTKTHDFKGGFILMSGKVEINLSFPHLVQKIVRPATELKVAKILFP